LIPYSYDEQAGQYNQGVLITITNISRLKFIENALKQSQQQFKSLLINRSERLEHRIEKIKQVTVLLIDDDSIDRLRVNRLLKEPKNRKYTILEAPTLDEANKLIESNNVDVCLLDYQLAGNTAEDFTKIMKDKNIDIPIILLSGQSESIMNEDFLENEIFDVIDKEDLSRLLLVRIIDYTLERQQIKNIVQNFEI
jgi:CheY-like chemotaxis protein